MTLLDELRERRTAARTAADEIITRAATGGDDGAPRDLTPEEMRSHAEHVGTLREIEDRIETLRDDEMRALRAAQVTGAAEVDADRGRLVRRDQSVTDYHRARGHITDGHAGLSFGAYLRGIATGEWQNAEHERALAEGTNTAGGHIVPTPLAANVIDLARAQTRVIQAGATTVPMTSATLKIPRLTSEGAPSWKAENAAVTAADMVFGAVTLSAKTMVREILMSVELFEDADPSAGAIIERSFAAQFALELDRVALLGSGTSNQPQGVVNQAGITTTAHSANGASVSYDFLLDAAGAVRANNFEPSAHIVASRSGVSLGKLKDSTGQYLAAPVGLLPVLQTNQVPINLTTGTSSDTSYVFTADWSQLLIGIRTGFTLKFLGERYFGDNLQYAFVAYERVDVQLAQPGAFVVDTGVRG